MRTRLVTPSATEVTLRPATDDDESFLHDLYADRRAAELEAAGWGPAERRSFVDMQFRAQQAGYGSTFPDADHWVVIVGDKSIGRLLVDRRSHDDLVVDVVVHSSCRGLGIGTVLMREVMGAAGAAGRGVLVAVAAHDLRVIRWYERLGFVAREHAGPLLRMAWRPHPAEGP